MRDRASKKTQGSVPTDETSPVINTDSGIVSVKVGTAWFQQRRVVIVTIIILVTVIIAAGYLLLQQRLQSNTDNQEVVMLDYKKGLVSQVETLDEGQLAALGEQNVDASKDINAAYAKAMALSQQDNNATALDLFKKIVATGKATYEIHESYALVALRANDNELAKKQIQTAISKLEQDPSVRDADKAAAKKRLESKLSGINEENS